MEEQKRKRLEAKGWKVGSPSDFLGLTEEEEKYIELRLILRETVRESRKEKQLTQEELAQKVGSNQSRIAKMEAGDNSVSIDFIFRSLFALGLNFEDLSKKLVESNIHRSRRV